MTVDLGLIIFTLTAWTVVGFFGQILFAMRFVIQWVSSERARKSVMPIAFWYFSIAGGATLLIYAIHLSDPVFIFGQGLGLVIYIRNLVLIYKDRKQTADVG
ncbi:MAG: lipid-A-disaccharide synthase N-terminal domain-containing protein [Rhodospirillaceae bacterium]